MEARKLRHRLEGGRCHPLRVPPQGSGGEVTVLQGTWLPRRPGDPPGRGRLSQFE